ncbi:hypothetical protein Tco_0800555 [Tanacetum coccineum]|uniref:Uncharacterized protein n=1 Tax=Tanacetum coccineum TaxID=301880 RepID=A0ABQ4ZUF9_9ASTR
MAQQQQIIPADQLVAIRYQSIRRCNNYVVLQNIPCSPDYVPAVYLQQYWKTVNKVPNTKDTIKFKLDMKEIVYTVDMFRYALNLPVETPDN